MIDALDAIIRLSLQQLAEDQRVRIWKAKERDWVSYYTHRFLFRQISDTGPIHDPAQVGIEVAVRQPVGYGKPTVARDVVIWNKGGDTCWDSNLEPNVHPMAIMEWKVHRPKHRNPDVEKERIWLRKYCAEQPRVVAYAVEVTITPSITTIDCTHFLGTKETASWFHSLCKE